MNQPTLSPDVIERAVSAAQRIQTTGLNRVVTREYINGFYVEEIIIGMSARLSEMTAALEQAQRERYEVRVLLMDWMNAHRGGWNTRHAPLEPISLIEHLYALLDMACANCGHRRLSEHAIREDGGFIGCSRCRCIEPRAAQSFPVAPNSDPSSASSDSEVPEPGFQMSPEEADELGQMLRTGSPLSADSTVKRLARTDPNYRPYCLRCRGLVRMRKIEDLYWRCDCGAEHDERGPSVSAAPSGKTAPTEPK